MTRAVYGTPELTDLGVLNVDTLSGSGRGGRRRKPSGGRQSVALTEVKRPRRDDGGDVCKKTEDGIWCPGDDIIFELE